MIIKAITLHQPWATLIALGFKTFETRSWATLAVGDPLAIHAGKKNFPRMILSGSSHFATMSA